MKRAAIITITNSGMNFGNRIQNYALQTVLEGHSVCVETIYSAKGIKKSILLSTLRRLFKTIIKTSKRRRHFNSFEGKYIKKAKRVRYERINDHYFKNKYDAFIAGSDQVWNPTFGFNSEFEFMTFAEPAKRYSYAASFGVGEIPEEHRQAFAERLSQLQAISVREDKGKDIVKRLTNREAKVHIDPTMLLTAGHYSKIEEKPKSPIPDQYLLSYFLGQQKAEHRAFIEQVAQKQNLAVLELSELADSALYHVGPQHFLYLLRHAEYICTDSFHGTIFSILFHKQFTVFYRYNKDVPMNSRVETLLEKMEIENRLFGELTIEASLEDIPYHHVDRLLEKERQDADEYLRAIIERW